MSKITIVTAFFDIGRGDWTVDKGLPHYLQRTTDTYIERFTHLTKLENEIIVVTTADIGERLKKIRSDIKIIEYNPFDKFRALADKIDTIQKYPAFQQMISPGQVKNPEYWSYKYVLVNILKSHFINLAIKQDLVSNDTVAWLDFGYCRNADTLPKCLKWEYNFNPEKIHLFAYKELAPGTYMNDIIANNDVHILGAKIVADKKLWPSMEKMMLSAFELLFRNQLIDDDQTLMLICANESPELFEQHRIPDHQLGLDPFVILKTFNDAEQK